MGVDSNLQGVPNFNALEIVKTGTITVNLTAPATQATNTVSHNLGFVPVYLAYITTDDQLYNAVPWTLFNTTAGLITYDAYVTATDLVARITKETNDSNDNSVTVKYYLFKETTRTQ